MILKHIHKALNIFKKLEEKTYPGVKIIKESDLPIRLGNSQVAYSIDLVKGPVRSGNVVQIRSSVRGNPISFVVKNSFQGTSGARCGLL